MDKRLSENKIPTETKQFILKELEMYPEILDIRGMNREELIWYQSRRAYLLAMKKKIEAQEREEGY